jgi:uncharacterized protein
MEVIALTGINPSVIEELKKAIPRTVELTSAHNVISLGKVSPGSMVFMTNITCEDIAMGDSGIIVEIISITISMKHMVEITNAQSMIESERMSARIKVKFLASSTIRNSVTCCQITNPRVVDVVRPVIFIAG